MKKRNSNGLILGLALSFVGILGGGQARAVTQEIALPLGQLGAPKVQISVPDSAIATGSALPVIFVVSGFQTARQLAPTMASAAGNNIVVIFEYPLEDKSDWLSWSKPEDAEAAASIAKIPLQIVGALNWIRGPALTMQYGVSADLHRINAVAISLGILFLPSALRLDQLQGHSENTIVFAYAGARLDLVAAQQMKTNGAETLANILGQAVQVLAAPFEPANYVKALRASRFLVLSAENDQIFPPESQQALVSTTPQPRDVIAVPGPHIGLNQPGRVLASLALLKNWLLQNSAVNP